MNGWSVCYALSRNRLVVNEDLPQKDQSLLIDWYVPFLLYFLLQILNRRVRVYLDFLRKIYASNSDSYLWTVMGNFLHHKGVGIYRKTQRLKSVQVVDFITFKRKNYIPGR